MKNFNQLTIGDCIYRICDNAYLGNPEKQQVNTILIKNIKLGTEGKNIYFNETNGYSNKSYDLVIPVELANSDLFIYETSNGHYKHVIFSDPEKANLYVREHVVKKINEIESSIPVLVAKKKKDVEQLRSTFYEILNPSVNADYNILQS